MKSRNSLARWRQQHLPMTAPVRRDQRGGAVAPVVVGPPLGHAGQHRLGAVERLDCQCSFKTDPPCGHSSTPINTQARRRTSDTGSRHAIASHPGRAEHVFRPHPPDSQPCRLNPPGRSNGKSRQRRSGGRAARRCRRRPACTRDRVLPCHVGKQCAHAGSGDRSADGSDSDDSVRHSPVEPVKFPPRNQAVHPPALGLIATVDNDDGTSAGGVGKVFSDASGTVEQAGRGRL